MMTQWAGGMASGRPDAVENAKATRPRWMAVVVKHGRGATDALRTGYVVRLLRTSGHVAVGRWAPWSTNESVCKSRKLAS